MSFLCEDCVYVLGDKNDSILLQSIYLETVELDPLGKSIPYTKNKLIGKDVIGRNEFTKTIKYIREHTYGFKCTKCNKPRYFIDKVSGVTRFFSFNDKKLISSKSDGAIFYGDLIKRTKSKSEKDRINKLVDDYWFKREEIESKKSAKKLKDIDKIRKDQRKSMSFWDKNKFFIILGFFILFFSALLLNLPKIFEYLD
tara:strand:+ start:256 stop:849 length:594 start_codon:yes stop_codon:yes gene_type:complete